MKTLRESIIDFIYRSATAPERIRRRLTPLGGAFFIGLVLLLIFVSLLADRFLGFPPLSSWPQALFAALPLIATGASVWLWSVLQFVRAKGTPVPLNPPPRLVEEGPYRYVRNPMLAGVFIMLLGLGVLFRSWSLTVIFTPLFILCALLEFKLIEEPELERRLGGAYRDYRSRTPMIIPRLRSLQAWLLTLLLLPAAAGAQNVPGLPLEKIQLPPGFRIDLYASGVKGARSLALGPAGVLFVGTRDEGKVYAIVDKNGDQKADEIITIAMGLNMPNGVAYRDGALYVAEVSRILRFDNIADRLYNPPKPVIVSKAFPSERHHGWKYIAFGPDGLLYVPVGAPCNVCDKKDGRYASIMRMKPDGKGLEIFASGVRNTVGFDWHPETKELWFTDNGRDWMGDDRPPDELNRAPQKGMHFGFPYCHGGDIPDPSYGKNRNCSQYTPPAMKLGPHVAALGMKFYTGAMFPAEYRKQIFIAEHGSWNRSVPIGYRITLVRLDKNRAVSYETFAEGWLQGTKAWGRPVDVLVMPDGALLVSDDQAGVIYRISYQKK
jgi:glucose/arabinose dehydrogenase/protein-S-isoprenylcysteine O-methyltransferase Ste14